MKKLQDFLLLTSQATFFSYFKRNFTNNILSKYHLGKTIPKFHSVHWVISPLFFAKPPITYSNYSSPPFYAIPPSIYWFFMNSPPPHPSKKKKKIRYFSEPPYQNFSSLTLSHLLQELPSSNS